MNNPKKLPEVSTTDKVEKERLNLYLPKPLVDDLRVMIPARERTQFITDVLARELRRRKLLNSIEKSYGAWKDQDHPELATGVDIDHWIQELRS
jgi:hypothetical protein